MPYIESDSRRCLLAETQVAAVGQEAENGGELNYLFTLIADEYLYRKGLSYANIGDVISAMECAKLELYRRIAAPYEDQKMKENGDVYTVR